MLTGATGGIGAATARALRDLGYEVVAVVRDPARAQHVREAHRADLADLDDVARVGRELAARLPRVDVLVNNAGVHAFSQRVTVDGLPIMVAVNHVAPFVLTQLLLPRLRESGGRVVNVASDAHRRVKTLRLPDDLLLGKPFNARESSLLYAQSKLLDVLFSKALARRLAGSGVTTNSCCPGLNVTGLGRESRMFSTLARLLNAVGAFSPEHGARIVVKLATDPEFANTSGTHVSHRGDVKPDTPLVADLEIQERLWAETAALPAVARLELFE